MRCKFSSICYVHNCFCVVVRMDLRTEPEEARNLAQLIEEEEEAEASGSARPLVLKDPKKKAYLEKLRPRVAEAVK